MAGCDDSLVGFQTQQKDVLLQERAQAPKSVIGRPGLYCKGFRSAACQAELGIGHGTSVCLVTGDGSLHVLGSAHSVSGCSLLGEARSFARQQVVLEPHKRCRHAHECMCHFGRYALLKARTPVRSPTLASGFAMLVHRGWLDTTDSDAYAPTRQETSPASIV